MIEQATPNRGIQLPHPANDLEEDLPRIRAGLMKVDSDLATIFALLTSDDVNLDSVQEIVTVLKNAEGDIGTITALLSTKADKTTLDGHVQSADKGGTGKTSYTPYSILYASGAAALAEIAPNTAASLKALCMTGTGAAGAIPAWTAVAASDHVQAADKGGTGKTTYTPYSILYASGATALAEIAPNITNKLKALCMIGTGTEGAQPNWAELSPAAIGAAKAPAYTVAPAVVGGVLTIDMAGAAHQKCSVAVSNGVVQTIKIDATNKTTAATVYLQLVFSAGAYLMNCDPIVTVKPGSGIRPMLGGLVAPTIPYKSTPSLQSMMVVLVSNGQGDVMVSGLPYAEPA